MSRSRFNLIAAKLNTPSVRAPLVNRQRLNRLLDSTDRFQLTALCSPAGYGKTTLVADWLKNSQRAHSWYNLDALDNDPLLFWQYIFEAIKKHHHKFGNATDNLLSQKFFLEDDLLSCIISDLHSFTSSRYRPDNILLVLDNFQCITSASIHQSLDRLLDYLPSYFHLLIIGRTKPNLNLTARIVRQEAQLIQTNELKLTKKETETFIKNATGKDLSLQSRISIYQQTQGWIALLQLALLTTNNLSSQLTTNISKINTDDSEKNNVFSGNTRQALTDFIVEEVVSGWSKQEVRLYSLLSNLPCVSAALINALLTENDAQFVLNSINSNCIFSISTGKTEAVWYEFHPLIKGWLQSQNITQTDHECRKDVLMRAAEWFIKNKLHFDALTLFFQLKEHERAARLLSDLTESLVNSGHELTYHNLLKKLPEHTVERFPRLLLGQCILLFRKNNLDIVSTLVTRVKRRLPVETEENPKQLSAAGFSCQKDVSRCYQQVRLIESFVLRGLGQTEEAQKLCHSMLNECNPANETLNWVYLGLAADHYKQGDIEKAVEYAYKGVSSAKQSKEIGPMTFCLTWLLHGLLESGKVPLAKQVYTEEMDWLKAHLPENSGHFYRLYGVGTQIYLEGNQKEKAEACYRQCQSLEQEVWNEDIVYYRYMAAISLALANKHPDQAHTKLDELSLYIKRDYSKTWSYVIPTPTYLKAVANIASGHNFSDILQSLSLPARNKYDSTFAYYADCSIYYSLMAMKDIKYDKHLAEVESWSESRGMITTTIRTSLSRSRAAFSHQKFDSAQTHLFKAIRLAKQGGYIGLMLSNGPALIPGLQLAIKNRLEADYCHYLISELTAEKQDDVEPANPGSSEPLTVREKDISRLLKKGLDNTQIAEHLGLKLNTVKTHLKNIYSKLGAKNRIEAARFFDEDR